MPELPEVETIVRRLEARILGAEVEAVRLLCPRLLRRTPARVLGSLEGKKISGLRRRGKMILVDCDSGWTLVFHLKMTGQMLLLRPDVPVDKHSRLRILFKGANLELRFRDVRRFGFLVCLGPGTPRSVPELDRLGPEPFSLDRRRFEELLQGRKGRVKSLLLDQTFVSGIGNIYADEILFRARVHPLTPASALRRADAGNLWKSMGAVLRDAISKKGSTIRDFSDPEGTPGEFQEHNKVYGRAGEACLRCGTPIARIRVGARSSFFCPNCQTEMN